MKILVIGGMHGNEPLGLELVKAFHRRPTAGVTAIYANSVAIAADTRFVKCDLNRTFPGDRTSKVYEIRRAAEIVAMTSDYDLILDFHNTYCPDNDCGFIGEQANKSLYRVATWLGLRRLIVADYDCLNKYAPNCLSVEISLDSPFRDSQWWRSRITALAKLAELPADDAVERYRFVYRMTLEDRDRLGLLSKKLRAFQPLSDTLAKQLGVASPAYPIFIGDRYTPYNYGGLVNKIDV
ncbi:MAG TPA: succinylglutamate desuccinylase/aspartoacylase family protein [Candidatus Saccharimonadales bacterium]|nr:succinylglutamate desuccinylase/aspartoacylase family protein [Candidatus Saccharimonadales bacterium]